MVTVNFSGTKRTELGTKAAKDARRAGQIPCVLYGPQKENIHFTATIKDVRDLIYTGDFKMANLTIDGQSYRCIVKSVDFHPVRDTVDHIDFLQLEDGQKIKVEVPLRFTGTSPGVRAGGKFIHSVRKIKIKTKVEDLIDEVTADISTLKLGSSIRVRDIEVVEGVEVMNPGALPVASVVVPRSLKGADVDDEEGTEGEGEGETEAAAEE